MTTEPLKEHQWLHKLTGEWTFEAEAIMKPGEPPVRSQGTETVRSVGGLWIVAEGQSDMPGCGPATTILTVGYDPEKKRHVGTWIGSMMTRLWLYEGALDDSADRLALETEGPDMAGAGKTVKYRDVIEFKSAGHRTLTSQIQGADGNWVTFVTANYRRKP